MNAHRANHVDLVRRRVDGDDRFVYACSDGAVVDGPVVDGGSGFESHGDGRLTRGSDIRRIDP
jgi:hypothetical protein